MPPSQIAAAGVVRSSDSHTTPSLPDASLHLALIRHSLGWLAAASLVGVWLAANLVWPALGGAAGSLSYGRWMPLHTDWMLYGWIALPLVSLLFGWFPSPDRRHAAVARGLILLWSVALGWNGLSWLTGNTSGKLFLAATGGARLGIPLVVVGLWACLAANLWHRRTRFQNARLIARGVWLGGLLSIPLVLWWAGEARIYPSVNPDSGGATGASLLGSSLLVLAMVGLLPPSLGLKSSHDKSYHWIFAGYWGLSLAVYGVIDHGNVSHHEPMAIAGVASLLAWWPILTKYLNSFEWGDSPVWRSAVTGWWALLVVNGVASFLPGISERLKFTNGMVAHAHMAMAGFSTAVCFVILQKKARGRVRESLENPLAFWAWQAGNLVFIGAMLALGWREGAVPGVLFRNDELATALYTVRLTAGAAMATTSCWWFYRSLGAENVRA
jgi:cytochrome c oxidase cbb3-type subunit 1